MTKKHTRKNRWKWACTNKYSVTAIKYPVWTQTYKLYKISVILGNNWWWEYIIESNNLIIWNKVHQWFAHNNKRNKC